MIRLQAEWEVSMPLPKKNHALQYTRILQALGHEARQPEEVKEGWVVKWRKFVPQRSV